MWTELIRSVEPDALFAPGATDDELGWAEAALGLRLPPDLRAMLSETDGVVDGRGWTVLLWPLDRVVAENLEARQPDWPFHEDGPWDSWLRFADSGFGQDFYFDVMSTDGGVCCWNYIDRDGYQIATDLGSFLTGWISGSFRIH